MIDHPSFTIEPWAIRETHLDLDVLPQTESVFAVSNGHFGWRGNLDEGEPNGVPGSYLNGVFEYRPLPYAESGYGYPGSGQTVINVTNGKLIRLLVDDEPFDVRYGTLEHHERVLDFRAGTLERWARWTSPAGRTVKVHSTRLVSFNERAVAAILYEVEAVDPVSVVVQSELVANESLPDLGTDPRSSAALASPLVADESMVYRQGVVMTHHTRVSGVRMAAAMDHKIEGPDDTQVDIECAEDVSRVVVATRLKPGETLRLIKLVAYGWSTVRSISALHDQTVAALAEARRTTWSGLLDAQRQFLDEFWAGADVELDGDARLQQAVRFGLFHIMQSAVRAEQRPIPAKGLTGPGYDGHTFWDSETFVLPVLTYAHPTCVADLLAWRKSTLGEAEKHAEDLGLQGAAFAWRTIAGAECSGYWPAGTAAFHINADIADAVLRYVDAVPDEKFEREVGLPLLVGTARLWRSLGQHDIEGAFRIDGVTGPDEYSAVADNNVYTNLMAEENLRQAAEMAMRHWGDATALGVTTEEIASWRDAADAMWIPFDHRIGVHPQSQGFTHHAVWDFEHTGADQYPLLLHFPYFDLYRKQVVKQADLVLAMWLRSDRFTPEQKRANFDYYEALTVRDSSLSAATQSVIAAEVGHMDLAYDYLAEAAFMDLDDLEHNTRDGLHMASLAGAWTALVCGFAGLRARGGLMSFSPHLPEGFTRLRFKVQYRGSRLEVDMTPSAVTYRLLAGSSIDVEHAGERIALKAGHTDEVEKPLPRLPSLRRPKQPQGRAPAPHGTAREAEGR